MTLNYNYTTRDGVDQSNSIFFRSGTLQDRHSFRNSPNILSKYAFTFSEGRLDLNEHLVKNPSGTFLIRVTGDSMINAGISSGSILVVDRNNKASNNKIVVASVNDELVVKRLRVTSESVSLVPENDKYQPLVVSKDDKFDIWGVVTSVIRTL